MIDPYTDKEGNSYEKTQIIMWLGTSKTSPITRNYLDETHLSNNIALKRSIDGIKDQLREEQLRITTQIMAPELKEFTEILLSYVNNEISENEYNGLIEKPYNKLVKTLEEMSQ